MGKEKTLIKIKAEQNPSEVSAFLHQLADSIAAGQLSLSHEEHQVLLRLPQNLYLKVEMEEEEKEGKGVRQELELSLKWTKADSEEQPLEANGEQPAQPDRQE